MGVLLKVGRGRRLGQKTSGHQVNKLQLLLF